MIFDHSSFPIREDLLLAHRHAWEQFATPGTWWSGTERVAIMALARHARGDAEIPEAYKGCLPENAVEAVTRISADLHHINRSWFDSLINETFTDGHYVEIISICSILANIDRFYSVLGIELESLPTPKAGDPTHYRPDTAVLHDTAWVSMIPPMSVQTGPDSDIYHGAKATAVVITAQSLVPDAIRLLNTVQDKHYVGHKDGFLDMGEGGRAITRGQIEYVAGRVSAFNQCFY